MKKHFNQLTGSLSKIFNWHKSRVDCFSNLLLSLLSARTVNLAKIALYFKNNNLIESNYRRTQSFFKDTIFDFDAVAEFNVQQLLSNKQQLYLILDRTNWQFGKADINILVPSAVYEGIAVPLYYEFLDHKGNSNSECRINLIERFISKFGKERIDCVLGNREFIGKKWIGWLDSENIDYVVRIKNNQLTTASNGGETKVSRLFHDIDTHQHKNIKRKCKLGSLNVNLSGTRAHDGELLIVASNSNKITNLIPVYGMRWEIENLFQALKGRGFNFEDTHMTDLDKLAKLLVLLSMAFIWVHKVSEYKDVKLKNIHENYNTTKNMRKSSCTETYILNF